MAEGFVRQFLVERELHKAAKAVCSAGIETHGLNPRAVEVMAEVGVDISAHLSTNLQEYLNDRFDFVITVCDNAARNCPVFPGRGEKLHWPFEDPAAAEGSGEEILDEFRKVRDQIKKKTGDWLASSQ
ncbi:MAG: arsenate reductase ArsC [bacterium]|nr:arsenate reductase ArsC [bacterium]